jgi:hypothetical protein
MLQLCASRDCSAANTHTVAAMGASAVLGFEPDEVIGHARFHAGSEDNSADTGGEALDTWCGAE